MGTPSPPPFFVTAHSKGVTDAIFVSAHSKGVIGGQFRPKPRKTRCLLVSAHSEGVRGEWRVRAKLKKSKTDGTALRRRGLRGFRGSEGEERYGVGSL